MNWGTHEQEELEMIRENIRRLERGEPTKSYEWEFFLKIMKDSGIPPEKIARAKARWDEEQLVEGREI